MYFKKFQQILIVFFFVFSYVFVLSYETNAQELRPEIEIFTPISGFVFEEDQEIVVSFKTKNFTFVNFKNNSVPFPGTTTAGHGHLWINTPDKKLEHDNAQKLLSPSSIRLPSMEKGKYIITIELTQNHHVSYEPPVRAKVKFFVNEKSGILSRVFSNTIFDKNNFIGEGSLGKQVSASIFVSFLLILAVILFLYVNKHHKRIILIFKTILKKKK